MAVKYAGFGNHQFLIPTTGAPASGYKLWTYVAGSSTLVTTYTTSVGNVSQSNPIILNSAGFPTIGQIWVTEGTSTKIVFTDASDVVIKTEDNIPGVNDAALTADEWVSGPTPTFVSTTSFTLVGDQTSTFHVGRRVKTTNSGGTIYSRISVTTFTTLTTVTVVNDSGVLDSGLSAVSYGLLSAENFSIPQLTQTNKRLIDLPGLADNNTFSGNNTHSGTETFNKEIILGSQSEVATANTLQLVGGNATFHITNTGFFAFKAPALGTGGDRLHIYAGDGVTGGVVGCDTSGAEPTGGVKGNGTINFHAVYDLGNRVYSDASDVTSTTALSGLAGTEVSLTHGFGAVPSFFEAVLVCTTIDNSYAVNNEVRQFQISNDTNNFGGGSVYADATYVKFPVAGGGYNIKISGKTGTGVAITLASWSIKLRAWK